MQVNFNPSLASLAKATEDFISHTEIEVQGQEVRWYSPAVFNHFYGKMIVDEVLAMLQQMVWDYDADERFVSAQALETAMQIIKNRFG